MKHLVLNDWAEFEQSLRAELATLGHATNVVARSFALTSIKPDFVEADRLALVLSTGTDRDGTSAFWNEPSFDHDHARDPQGKDARDILYAFTLDLSTTPYLVDHGTVPTSFDITDNLSPYDGIVIYDPRGLRRVSENEYWFSCDPLHVALFVITVKNSDLESGATEVAEP